MNIPATTLLAQALSVSSDNVQLNHMPLMNEENISSSCDENEADYEKVLLTESEMLYNKIIDIAINKTINSGVKCRGSVSQQREAELSSDQKWTSRNFSTYAYRREEEETIIQSQLENEEDKDLERV
jgi:hypothetical protein